MSHPNTPPPEEPDDRERRRQGQEGGGGQPPPAGPRGDEQPGYGPSPGTHPPGGETGYGPPPGGHAPGGHQQGGYPPGGYPQGGYQPGGYPQGGFEPSSATTGQPNQAERQMGLIAHLGGGLAGFFFSGFGWIVPLIVFLVKKDESPFVRDQSVQALNFQILVTIGIVVSWLLTIVLIGILTWVVVAVVCLVLGILGGVAANRGEWYRYPFNVNWVK
ncbi:DUF4870 domain-containing protein [Nocardiopsis lucentensis]|uniref:DUF4870 domain-containing protein n=1 Tax=Nocardiopsis lucentensis TaxID=53441 RepID=UPI00034A42A8|nr:DUF4870 domain-containing protein [Nocardiopsis lucentensis]